MKAYQLKITIKDSHPPIWRRIIVPAEISFAQLSYIINESFEWSGYHLSGFYFWNLNLSVDNNYEYDDWGFSSASIDGAKHRISEFFDLNPSCTYTYDFGDCWDHQIKVEKVIEDYPLNYPSLIKGKGEAPMEDCGGIWGYYETMGDGYPSEFPDEHKEYIQSKLNTIKFFENEIKPALSYAEINEKALNGDATMYAIDPALALEEADEDIFDDEDVDSEEYMALNNLAAVAIFDTLLKISDNLQIPLETLIEAADIHEDIKEFIDGFMFDV